MQVGEMTAEPTLDEIKARLKAMLPDLRQRYAVSYLGVFGSWTRGEQRAGSDLDLLVDFDRIPPVGGTSISSSSSATASA